MNWNNLLQINIPGRQISLPVDCYINNQKISASLFTENMALGESTESRGKDRFGEYCSISTSLVLKDEALAVIEIRHYTDCDVLSGFMHYNSQVPVRAEDGLGVTLMDFPGFLRGMGSAMYTEAEFPYIWVRPFFAGEFGAIPDRTNYYMWQLSDGTHASLTPLSGGGARGSVRPNKDFHGFGVSVSASNLCGDHASFTTPLFSLALHENPYKAAELAFKAGFATMEENGRHREEKSHLECFDYLGWCSWNAYYRDINQDKLLATAKSFSDNAFPIGWMLIDDGWQDAKDGRLQSFGTDRGKFPGGLSDLVSNLKDTCSVKWVGVWHALTGYWNGVEPQGDDFHQESDMIVEIPNGRQLPVLESFDGVPKDVWIPSLTGDGAYRFFSAYHERLKAEGVSFVKVDNQSCLYWQINGVMPVQSAMHAIQRGLQRSADENFDNAIINCMSQSVDATMEWHMSNIGRVSNDYIPGKPRDFQIHIADSFYNAIYWSQLCWPDYDMFESHHPNAEPHAIARAISGGPVYFTDTPGKENWDILRKLVFRDGRLVKPDNPALSTRDCIYTDTRRNPALLKAFNTCGRVGVVAGFNVCMEGMESLAQGSISPSDVDGIEGEVFAVYDYFTGSLQLVPRDNVIPVEVDYQLAKLFIISPVEDGFAPIGLVDKYICPAGIASVVRTADSVTVELREGGRFTAYCLWQPSAIFAGDQLLPPGDYTWQEGHLEVVLPLETTQLRIVK